MRFLFLTKKTKNKILLFSFFGLFGKIFLLQIFLKNPLKHFLSSFFIFNENKNRKQLNQTFP